MILPIDTENTFDNSQHPFMIKKKKKRIIRSISLLQRHSHRVEKCSMWLFKLNRYSHWGQHSKGKHILYYDPYTGKVKNTSPKRGGIRRAGGRVMREGGDMGTYVSV